MQLDELDVRAVAEKVPERARAILALAGVCVLALVAARPGFVRIREWWDISSAQNYYYEYGYSGEALIWFAIAAVAIGLGMAGRSREDLKWTLAGASLALLALFVQPLVFDRTEPMERGRQEMSTALFSLQEDISKLAAESGHLPFAKSEIARLYITGAPTPIIRAGSRHSFRLIVAGQRDEVFQSPPIAAAPGDIYYTISSDEKTYALSVVGIDANVSETLIIDRQLSKAGLGR
jgi:hypothetical protein